MTVVESCDVGEIHQGDTDPACTFSAPSVVDTNLCKLAVIQMCVIFLYISQEARNMVAWKYQRLKSAFSEQTLCDFLSLFAPEYLCCDNLPQNDRNILFL